MTKGYWIAEVDVHDPDAYKDYIKANAAAFARYGARFLVRGGTSAQVEGQGRARCVVLQFPSYATALACYQSAEYAAALALRQAASTADVLIIEGCSEEQPSV